MKSRNIRIGIIVVVAVCVMIATFILSMKRPDSEPSEMTPKPQTTTSTPSTTSKAEDAYEGQEITISDKLRVIVPDGWRASVSTNSSFLGVQFARPGQIESLVYNKSVPPMIDYNGIPSWSGLTEHFYIRQITNPSQVFDPADHDEVTSELFTFKDGTVGTTYSVTKHTTEAQRYGGLLKDTEWYGRVFVYAKGDTIIEAHLAYYPSTKIEPGFYKKVAGSIKLID